MIIKSAIFNFMLCLLAAAYPSTGRGQQSSYTDSLFQVLRESKSAKEKLSVYMMVGQYYHQHNPELAKHYYRRSRDLSAGIPDTSGMIWYVRLYADLLTLESKHDSSIQLCTDALNMARVHNQGNDLQQMLVSAGTAWQKAAQFEQAIPYFQEANSLQTDRRIPSLTAKATMGLHQCYASLGDLANAEKFGIEAVALYGQTPTEMTFAQALDGLGYVYLKSGKTALALPLFRELNAISKSRGDKRFSGIALSRLIPIYEKELMWDSLKPASTALRTIASVNRDTGLLSVAVRGLATWHMARKEYPIAHYYAMQSLAYAEASKSADAFLASTETISKLYYGMQDISCAEQFAQKLKTAKDSIQTLVAYKPELNAGAIDTASAKKALSEEGGKDQDAIDYGENSRRILLLAFMGLVLAAGGIFVWRYTRNRKLSNDVKPEKKLSRSAARAPASVPPFLDDIPGITMPELPVADIPVKQVGMDQHEDLVKDGLDQALQVFCKDFGATTHAVVAYQSFGADRVTVNAPASMATFRIARELVENAVKHGKAKQIKVWLVLAGGELNLKVEDDGRGFNPAQLQEKKGKGWTTIMYQIDLLQGKVDVQSELGRGTAVELVFYI